MTYVLFDESCSRETSNVGANADYGRLSVDRVQGYDVRMFSWTFSILRR